jgi:hypothetical protein
MRGTFTFQSPDPNESASVYIRTLAHQLDLQGPARVEIRGPRELTVSGGWLVSSWNLLVCVSLATIRTLPGDEEVMVEYEVKLTRLVVFCAVLSSILVAVAFLQWSAIPLVAAVAVWLWLFGMNYVIVCVRLPAFFRRAIPTTASRYR